MILIGLGANLPSERYGSPRATLEAALGRLPASGVSALRLSPWYSTAPDPPSDQPRYVNAVAAVETELDPAALLAVLHRIEDEFGRVRGVPNAARMIDLDLLAYHNLVRSGPAPVLPHPRLAQRAFVLLPLADLAPGWRHPVSGKTVEQLIAEMPPGQDAVPTAIAPELEDR